MKWSRRSLGNHKGLIFSLQTNVRYQPMLSI